MPRLLRKDSIRLFEASCDSLFLANIGLAIPRKAGQFRYAAELGLIGSAAEQAMSACLVEAFGQNVLLKNPVVDAKTFKSARQILAEFRKMLKEPASNSSFVVQGCSDAANHREEIHDFTEKFHLIIQLRASGLHAGMGSKLELATAMADDVARLLLSLAASTKIRPYLSNVPQPVTQPRARITLVEDLVRQIRENVAQPNVAGLITTAFLVLPNVPQQQPEWLDALERVQVAVNPTDVAFLVNVLSKAVPVTLVRQSDTGNVLPVKIQQENPSAVPVAFHYLKTSFTKLKEEWHAEVGLANGRFDKKALHVPPVDFLLDLFVVGLEKAGITDDTNQKISHMQTWPFIAAALECPGQALPYWFLVRQTEDLEQLRSYLTRAAALSKGGLKTRLKEFLDGRDALVRQKKLPSTSSLAISMRENKTQIDKAYGSLIDIADKQRGTDRDAGFELQKQIVDTITNEYVAGDLLSSAVENEFGLSPVAQAYWCRKFAEALDNPYDISALTALYRSTLPSLVGCRTSAKKALRFTDFYHFGPSFEDEEDDIGI